VIVVLYFVPVVVTAVLGPIWLLTSPARAGIKVVGVALFGVAVYLQFFSRHVLAGLLLQVAIAFSLAMWRKVGAV
jgi:hypothetical protein